MHLIKRGRNLCGLCGLLLLAACGGGGDSDTSSPPPQGPSPPPQTNPPQTDPPPTNPPPKTTATFSLSGNSISFSTNVNATPPIRLITSTISGDVNGKLSFRAQVDQETRGITASVDSNGTVRVTPVAVRYLQAGTTYKSTIAVTACVDDSTCATGQLAGSPQTLNVIYTIENPAVQGDIVAPRVVTAGESGEVILRGRGFSQATAVRFGNIAANDLSVISSTEIRAKYPALAAGRYAVSVDSGAIAFSAALVVVPAPNYSDVDLSYPATPQEIGGILYDSERQVLFVAAQYADSQDSRLIKFQFSGGTWTEPVSTPVPDIRDVALSPDGATLLVLTRDALMELDPVNLTSKAAYRPSVDTDILYEQLNYQNLVVANDGYAIVAANHDKIANGKTVHLFATQDHRFYDAAEGLNPLDIDYLFRGSPGPGASADGSLVLLAQKSRKDLDNNPYYVHQYVASSQLVSRTDLSFADVLDIDRTVRDLPLRAARPALDRTGTKIVLSGRQTVVYDRSYNELGTLPLATQAAVVKPDGSRAYTFHSLKASASGTLRTFDLTVQPAKTPEGRAGAFPEIGTGVVLNPGSGMGAIAMAISPDGGTLFTAGVSGIFIRKAQ